MIRFSAAVMRMASPCATVRAVSAAMASTTRTRAARIRAMATSGGGLQGVDGEMHEAERLQILRAESLVEGKGQLVAPEDRPDEAAGAARPTARRRLAHEGAADAAAARRRIDPEIHDVHDAHRLIDLVAEMVEEIADRRAVALGDDPGEGRIGPEAVAPVRLGAEGLRVGVAELAQMRSELAPHAADRFGIVYCGRADAQGGACSQGVAPHPARRARGCALS